MKFFRLDRPGVEVFRLVMAPLAHCIIVAQSPLQQGSSYGDDAFSRVRPVSARQPCQLTPEGEQQLIGSGRLTAVVVGFGAHSTLMILLDGYPASNKFPASL